MVSKLETVRNCSLIKLSWYNVVFLTVQFVLQLISADMATRIKQKQNETELQIRAVIKDNSKIIFLISQQKHML